MAGSNAFMKPATSPALSEPAASAIRSSTSRAGSAARQQNANEAASHQPIDGISVQGQLHERDRAPPVRETGTCNPRPAFQVEAGAPEALATGGARRGAQLDVVARRERELRRRPDPA